MKKTIRILAIVLALMLVFAACSPEMVQEAAKAFEDAEKGVADAAAEAAAASEVTRTTPEDAQTEEPETEETQTEETVPAESQTEAEPESEPEEIAAPEETEEPVQGPYLNDGTVAGVYQVYSAMGMPLSSIAIAMGVTVQEAADLMRVELKEDGTGSIDVNGQHADLTYTVEGTNLTLDVEGESITFPIEDGLIKVEFEGYAFTLARLTETAYTETPVVETVAEEYINDGTVTGTYLVYNCFGMTLKDAAQMMSVSPKDLAHLIQLDLLEDGKAFLTAGDEELEISYTIEDDVITLFGNEEEEQLSGLIRDGLITVEYEGVSFTMARLTDLAYDTLLAPDEQVDLDPYVNDGTLLGNYQVWSIMGMSLFEYAVQMNKEPEEVAELLQIELGEEGVAHVVSAGEEMEMPYTLDGENITIGEGADMVTGTLKDGLLTLEEDGFAVVLARLTDAAFIRPEEPEKGEAEVWTGEYTKMVGSETKRTDEEFSLELYQDGTGVHHRDGFDLSVTWSQEGDTFTMTESLGGLVYTGSMNDGELHLFNGDPEDIWTFEYVYSKQ